MKQIGVSFGLGLLIGSVVSIPVGGKIASAQVTNSWSKESVTPVVLVKPSFGAFVPAEGTVIGISWSKDEVVPVSIVKPSFGGFVPLQGMAIGITWSEANVKPVVLVEPSGGAFVPSNSADKSSQPEVPGLAADRPSTNSRTSSACSSPIETNIQGDFNGWEGETIYKMDDGSVWQQSNYHYHYHYAFHPSVLIFTGSSGQCHIHVEDDDDDGVDVVRIK